MASITTEPNGRRTIQFIDGKARKSIRLGQVSKKVASEIKLRVEAIVSAKAAGLPIDPQTAEWSKGISDDLADKFYRVGLLPRRAKVEDCPTLGEFVDLFVDAKQHVKDSTKRTQKVALNRLANAIGPARRLSEVTEQTILNALAKIQADDKHASQAYRAKIIMTAKEMFAKAAKRGFIAENPLSAIVAGSQVNKSRKVVVSAEDCRKLIASTDDPDWKVTIAMARWGGLRIPSELYPLRWSDIDWKAGRIDLPTPKLEHIPGLERRLIPLFPELREVLSQVQQTSNSPYLVPRLRLGCDNLRTSFLKIIKRAGLEPWPRVFQNLRASRSTELADQFPSHVVAAWLGHTEEIAEKHYRSVTEDHFERATKSVQNPVQSASELVLTEPIPKFTFETEAVVREVLKRISASGAEVIRIGQMGDTGFEPVTSTV